MSKTTFFHIAPMLLGAGSVILPGNWGRVLKLYTNANDVFYREHILETIRANEYPDKPSRLNALFVLDSFEEAQRYLNINNRTGLIYEVAVDVNVSTIHRANYNIPTSNFNLLECMPDVARKYWGEIPTENIETLIPDSAVVIKLCQHV